MYDYFFPKNMRDLQEKQKLVHKYGGNLNQTSLVQNNSSPANLTLNNLVKHQSKNQCELN